MEVLLDTCGRRTVKVLLLLHLFFAKATADCPKPQTRGDVVLTDNALLMNTFPKGVDVTLECANGFVKDSGSGVITCVDDNWTEPDLTCKIVTCEIPVKLTKGNSSWNSQDEPMYGQIIHYTCEEGYTLIGKNSRRCSESGEYDSPPPACEDSSATPTALRDNTVRTSTTAAASPSVG
ncbi:Complement component receptor 1-like protein, partial [Dissostichus eleginoides]